MELFSIRIQRTFQLVSTMYAGGIFGIGVYVTTKFNHLVDKLKDKEENKNG